MSDASRTSPAPAPGLPRGDWLDACDGHRVWWAEGGDPRGLPVLIVHGGPGGASRIEPTRWFAGLAVRWFLLDQRGCGRSAPSGETASNDLGALLSDMERLREHRGLARWAVVGGSWGACVALAYARRWPAQVDGLFLRSPFTGAVSETRRYIAPWRRWLGTPGRAWLGEAAADAIEALFQGGTAPRGPDPGSTPSAIADDERAARVWSAYDELQSQPGGAAAQDGLRLDVARLPAATPAMRASWRVHVHYALGGWGGIDPEEPPPLGARPVRVAWGEADATCDPAAARSLVARLAGARATAVPGAGHRMGDPLLAPALAAAARDWVAEVATYSAARQRSLR